MQPNRILSHDDWIAARKELLVKEKEFTRQRDALTKLRRDLPWEKVDQNYRFDGPSGVVSLSDLFDGRSQLIVYHFMYGPDWDVGCKSCSYLADHFNPAIVHLNQRDVTMVAVSRAPFRVLEAFKKRMGWNFPWLSSGNSSFNHDYHVSFTTQEIDSGEAYYNYREGGFSGPEAPGASVFFRAADGTVYHTYSVYSRGLDMFITAYQYLDITPRGRDEAGLSYTMEWLRHHDSYDAAR